LMDGMKLLAKEQYVSILFADPHGYRQMGSANFSQAKRSIACLG
jgi:hypothetical protein